MGLFDFLRGKKSSQTSAGSSTSDDALVARAMQIQSQVASGNLQSAIAQIDALLTAAGLSQELKRCLHALRGSVREQLGDSRAAIQDFDAALNLPLILPSTYAPSTADLLLSRAGVRFAIGEEKQAISDYSSAIEAKDSTPQTKAEALWKRGMAKGAQQDFVGAHADFLEVLRLPDTKDIQATKHEAAEMMIADGALHQAAGRGNIEKVTLILAAGGNASAQDDNRTTPLHFAAAHGQTAITTLLLKHGANPEIRDVSGDCPIDVAKSCGHSDTHRLLQAQRR